MSSAAVTRPAPRRRSTTRPVRPVRPVAAPTNAPARAPFIVLVLVLLTVGLGTLLLLNTLLAQGSFTLHDVNAQVASLADREQALQQKASQLAAPQRLARNAQALGMVPSQNPAFLRSEDGKVLGEPVPAPTPVVVSPVVGSETAEATAGPVSGDQQNESNSNTASDSGQGGNEQGGNEQSSAQGNGGADR
jgi:hypothetical protein